MHVVEHHDDYSPERNTTIYAHTVGANRLERRRRKVRCFKIVVTLVPEQISISSVLVMGILTENFSPVA